MADDQTTPIVLPAADPTPAPVPPPAADTGGASGSWEPETVSQKLAQVGKEVKSRVFEPVKQSEIEKIPGLEPERVAQHQETGEDDLGRVFGKEKGDYVREHILHGFTPEVTARAAAKSLTDWYSPAMLAMSVPGRIAHGYAAAAQAAEEAGLPVQAALHAGRARLAGLLGTASGAPVIANQVHDTVENWDKMSPTERSAAVVGIVGGGTMMGVGAHEGGVFEHLKETAKTGVESIKEDAAAALNAKSPEGSLEAGFAKLNGKKVLSPKSAPQGGHAGGGSASEEELARPGRFVKVSRSGQLSDQNKTPDFNLRAGEVGYQVKPDGTATLVDGKETPAHKAAIDRYSKEVFPTPKPEFKQTLADRGQLPGQENNFGELYINGDGERTGGYVGGLDQTPRAGSPPKEPFSGTHFSSVPAEDNTLLGENRGKASAGSEKDRLQHENAVPGVYAYREGARAEPQIGGRSHKYNLSGDKAIADIGGAQKQAFEDAHAEAFSKYKSAGDNDTIANQKAVNDAEARLRDAGYDGYENKSSKTGSVFLFGDQEIGTHPEQQTKTTAEAKKSVKEEIPAGSKFVEATPEEHRAELDKNPQAATLSDKTVDQLRDHKIFKLQTPQGGETGIQYHITPDGEAGGFVNNGPYKNATAAMLKHAPEQGATHATAWDVQGKLPALYEKHGMSSTGSEKYDAAAFGEPSTDLKGAWKAAGWKEGDPYPSIRHLDFPKKSGETIGTGGTGEAPSALAPYAERALKAAEKYAVEFSPKGHEVGWILPDGKFLSTGDRIDPDEHGAYLVDRGLSLQSDEHVAAEKYLSSGGREPYELYDEPAMFGHATGALRYTTDNQGGVSVQASTLTPPTAEQVSMVNKAVRERGGSFDIEGFGSKAKGSVPPPSYSRANGVLPSHVQEGFATVAPKQNATTAVGGTAAAPVDKVAARGQKRVAEWKQSPAFQSSTGGTAAAPAAPAAPAGHESIPTVSTRTPSITVNKELVNDHSNHTLTSDMQAAASAPGFLKKLADRVSHIPGFQDPGGEDHDARTKAYIRHVADNTKFVQSKVTPEEHATDSQWYPVGAHERGIAVAKAHGLEPHQAYAATAALSPLTDWDSNTAQAERAAEIWHTQQDTKFTPEMRKAADEILTVPAMEHFAPQFNRLEGKTLGELSTLDDQAWWLRLHEEGHYDRSYQTWNPDGTPAGLALNQDGTPKSLSWSFQSLIENAIDIMKDGSHENISRVLGEGHKVRNFYNNQLSPDDPRFLTIDTHQVNIGQLRPMSGSYPDVADNFGTPSNAPYGLSGTYPLYDAGTRLAAKELGIDIPSRLQSSGWVKIRKVFTNRFKTEENLATIDAIWKEHSDGKITANDAREKIWDFAEGWNRANTRTTGNPIDQGKLPDAGVRGKAAKGTSGRGDRGDASSPDSKPADAGNTDFNFGENVKPTAETTSADRARRTAAALKGLRSPGRNKK